VDIEYERPTDGSEMGGVLNMVVSAFLATGVSATSNAWWSLFDLYLIIAIVASAFFIGWIIYLVVSTRERPSRHTPNQIHPGVIPSSNRGRPRNVIFLVLFLAIVFFGLYAYQLPITNYMRVAPHSQSNALVVKVYGAQWFWSFQYPNGYNSTHFAMLPVDTLIIFRVTSMDVMHEFSIPAFSVKIDAFPLQWNVAWTKVYQEGNYTAFCTELCGIGHATMWATIDVTSQANFNAWLAAHN